MNLDIVAEQMKFAQIVNLKTAKTLGLVVLRARRRGSSK